MSSNAGENDPLQQFDGPGLASPDAMRRLITTARNVLLLVPFEDLYEYQLRDEANNASMIFVAAETCYKQNVAYTTRIGVQGDMAHSAAELGLVYAADNELKDIYPQTKRERMIAARRAGPVVSSIRERRLDVMQLPEDIMMSGLLQVVEKLEAGKSVAGYRPHRSVSLFETVRSLALARGARVSQQAMANTTLADGSELAIMSRDYLFEEWPQDFDPSRLIRIEINLAEPDRSDIVSFIEFHDGSTFYDTFCAGDEEAADIGTMDPAFESLRASGIYRPMAEDVAKLTAATKQAHALFAG